MLYLLAFVVGFIFGLAGIAGTLWYQFQQAKQRENIAKMQIEKAKHSFEEAAARHQELDRHQRELEDQSTTLQSKQTALDAEEKAFKARVISYRELQDESSVLKRDLQNIDVTVNKLEIDRNLQSERQEQLDQRGKELGQRYLADTVKSVVAAIGPNNFTACKERLLKVIQWCREIGFEIPAAKENELIASLRAEFEKAVKAALEREEQTRIKVRMREEQKLAAEIEREMKQLDRERAAIQAALDRALAEATDKHSEEIQRLQTRLAEAEEKSRRAKSMAEQTKAGNVYVISNIGSFGENVFKIGMTRRLEPLDRISELSNASVPFEFDVHMMVACDDAPALENALHRELNKRRINRVNPRKEFFKVDLETILRIVRERHGDVQYVVSPEALAYHQSLTMSDEDAEYIEGVYKGAEEDHEATIDDV